MSDPDPAVRLHTVIVDTEDHEALAAFYRRAFELGEPEREERHLGFRIGEFYLGFDRIEARPGAGRGPVSLWFAVPDLEAAFERIVALGAEVRHPPTRKPWGGFLAALLDPDGNVLGLTEET